MQLSKLLLAAFAIHALAQTPPPGMMPYTAILDPHFVPASEASFLADDDILIGVAHGAVAKAFPAADLAQHGSVNDQMPDAPIEVTWCGVCNTGVVFRARFKGRLLHFEYDSMAVANEVHKDHETGSRWQQSTGEAISGPLKGSRLDLYPFVRTTWKEWRRRYPNTVVLKPLPGYDERMSNLSKLIRKNSFSADGAAPKAAFGTDDRLRPHELIAGLTTGNEVTAYPFSQLRAVHVVNDHVGSVPVLVVHQQSSDTTTAFEAQAKGRTLHFQAADADASSLTDLETHSKWDAYGLSLEGPLKGAHLKPLILIPEFWFAWSEFHPQTKVFTAPVATKILMREPLGEVTDPKMSMFFLNISGGLKATSHSHPGAVFAYLLEGDIENQVDPDPPHIYHPGGFFHEPQRHIHRFLHNLSETEPAKILIFQNGEAKLRGGQKPLLEEQLTNTTNQEATVSEVTLPPAASLPAAHSPVFGYVIEGELEAGSKTYRAGDAFYDPSRQIFRNSGNAETADVLLFEVAEITPPVRSAAQPRPPRSPETPSR